MTHSDYFAKPDLSRLNVPAKEARKNLINFPPHATDADYRAAEWWPISGSAPTFDPQTEQVSGPTYVADQNTETVLKQYSKTNKSLATVKQEHLQRLNAAFSAARDAGVYVAGILLETTPQVQAELTSLVARLQRVGGTQAIATRSGFVGDIDLATAQVLHAGVEDYISAVWQNDADKTAAIQAAETVQEVLAVDVSAGWPSRNEPE